MHVLQEAERLSREALAIDDRDPLRPNIITWSLASRGRFEEAEQLRQATIERFGLQNFWQQWVTLGYLNAHAGDSAGVELAFDAALSIDLSTVERALVDALRTEVLGQEN